MYTTRRQAEKNSIDYPSYIRDSLHLLIQSFEYQLPSTNDLVAGEISTQNIELTDIQDTIRLYMPSGFGDSMEASWSNKDVLPAGSAKAVTDLFAGGNRGSGDIFTALSSKISNITQGVAQQAAVAFSNLIPNIGGINTKATVEAQLGRVLALNRMKTFDGASDLALPLSFKFAPKNAIEMKSMLKIIDIFRAASKPYLDTTGKFAGQSLLRSYTFPPLFNITVVTPTEDNTPVSGKGFIQYKTMALTRFGVTYGNYQDTVSYMDTSEHKFAPTDANLNIQFESVIPQHNQDTELNKE